MKNPFLYSDKGKSSAGRLDCHILLALLSILPLNIFTLNQTIVPDRGCMAYIFHRQTDRLSSAFLPGNMPDDFIKACSPG